MATVIRTPESGQTTQLELKTLTESLLARRREQAKISARGRSAIEVAYLNYCVDRTADAIRKQVDAKEYADRIIHLDRMENKEPNKAVAEKAYLNTKSEAEREQLIAGADRRLAALNSARRATNSSQQPSNAQTFAGNIQPTAHPSRVVNEQPTVGIPSPGNGLPAQQPGPANGQPAARPPRQDVISPLCLLARRHPVVGNATVDTGNIRHNRIYPRLKYLENVAPGLFVEVWGNEDRGNITVSLLREQLNSIPDNAIVPVVSHQVRRINVVHPPLVINSVERIVHSPNTATERHTQRGLNNQRLLDLAPFLHPDINYETMYFAAITDNVFLLASGSEAQVIAESIVPTLRQQVEQQVSARQALIPANAEAQPPRQQPIALAPIQQPSGQTQVTRIEIPGCTLELTNAETVTEIRRTLARIHELLVQSQSQPARQPQSQNLAPFRTQRLNVGPGLVIEVTTNFGLQCITSWVNDFAHSELDRVQGIHREVIHRLVQQLGIRIDSRMQTLFAEQGPPAVLPARQPNEIENGVQEVNNRLPFMIQRLEVGMGEEMGSGSELILEISSYEGLEFFERITNESEFTGAVSLLALGGYNDSPVTYLLMFPLRMFPCTPNVQPQSQTAINIPAQTNIPIVQSQVVASRVQPALVPQFQSANTANNAAAAPLANQTIRATTGQQQQNGVPSRRS